MASNTNDESNALLQWFAAHPEVRHFPFILADGRWNAGDWTEWVEDGTVRPGPPSGRAPLCLGEATGADWQARVTMLLTIAHAHQEAADYCGMAGQLQQEVRDDV